MSTITFQDSPISTSGSLPTVGSQAPAFTCVGTDLELVTLASCAGSRCILNIFPSVDTEVCATSVQTFSDEVQALKNTKLITISRDTPFAIQRFLDENSIDTCTGASDLRNGSFGDVYGVVMTSGPLQGLLSRAVVVIDEQGKVMYAEQVAEITKQPLYSAALKVLGVSL